MYGPNAPGRTITFLGAQRVSKPRGERFATLLCGMSVKIPFFVEFPQFVVEFPQFNSITFMILPQ